MNTHLTQNLKYNNNNTISSQNTYIQLHRSDKRFQNPRNKPLLTSTELFKSNKPKPFPFTTKQSAISYSSSVKNTEESTSSTNNKNLFLKKQSRLKTTTHESQKHLDTDLHLNKATNIINNKKIKQVSIDLQHRYNKKSFPKKKKESCDICFITNNENGSSNPFLYEVTVQSQECFVSANASLKKHNSCNYYGNVVKRSLSKPILNIQQKIKKEENVKYKFKPRSNTYYIKSNNYINNKTVNNTNSTTPQQSQVFSSMSTLQTLFKINEFEPKHLVSKEQITEIEELNNKLNLINPSNNNSNVNMNKYTKSNSNHSLKTLHNSKCNIINAEMLDNSNNTHIVNKDVYISSQNRIQTYKLLLDCISNKFSEIQNIVQNDKRHKFMYGNDNNKISELHSKIEFTQDNIPKQNIKQTIINPYDIEDDELEEKTNMIIPHGRNSKTEPNDIGKINNNEYIDNMDYNSFLECQMNNNFNNNGEPTLSMNSDFIKTFLELNYEGGNNNDNIVSFLSNYQNEIKSFLQPSNSNGINCNNIHNSSENSDVIINNISDTMTTIIQSNDGTYNKIDSKHSDNIEMELNNNKVDDENNNNKCLLF